MKLPQAGSQQTRLNKGFRHWPSFRRWFVWNANHGYCHAVLSPFPARSRHVFAVHGHPIHVKNKFRGEKLRVIVTSERERERERDGGSMAWPSFYGPSASLSEIPSARIGEEGRLLGRALKNRRVAGNIDL